jgi:hypothetical protein
MCSSTPVPVLRPDEVVALAVAVAGGAGYDAARAPGGAAHVHSSPSSASPERTAPDHRRTGRRIMAYSLRVYESWPILVRMGGRRVSQRRTAASSVM